MLLILIGRASRICNISNAVYQMDDIVLNIHFICWQSLPNQLTDLVQNSIDSFQNIFHLTDNVCLKYSVV